MLWKKILFKIFQKFLKNIVIKNSWMALNFPKIVKKSKKSSRFSQILSKNKELNTEFINSSAPSTIWWSTETKSAIWSKTRSREQQRSRRAQRRRRWCTEQPTVRQLTSTLPSRCVWPTIWTRSSTPTKSSTTEDSRSTTKSKISAPTNANKPIFSRNKPPTVRKLKSGANRSL